MRENRKMKKLEKDKMCTLPEKMVEEGIVEREKEENQLIFVRTMAEVILLILEGLKEENEVLIQKAITIAIETKYERLRQEGKREGRLETLKEFVSNMIKRNMSIDEIQELTGISKEELEQIQKCPH